MDRSKCRPVGGEDAPKQRTGREVVRVGGRRRVAGLSRLGMRGPRGPPTGRGRPAGSRARGQAAPAGAAQRLDVPVVVPEVPRRCPGGLIDFERRLRRAAKSLRRRSSAWPRARVAAGELQPHKPRKPVHGRRHCKNGVLPGAQRRRRREVLEESRRVAPMAGAGRRITCLALRQPSELLGGRVVEDRFGSGVAAVARLCWSCRLWPECGVPITYAAGSAPWHRRCRSSSMSNMLAPVERHWSGARSVRSLRMPV